MQRWLDSIRSRWPWLQDSRLFTADRKIMKNRKLLTRTDADLANVGPRLTAVYLVLFAVIPGKLLLPFELCVALGMLMSVVVALTTLLGRRFEELYGAGPRRWRERMLLTILLSSALWICFVVLLHRSTASASVQFLLFGLTLTIVSYLAFALVAYRVVVKLVLLMTLIPVAVLWLFEAGLAGQLICMATLVYCVLLSTEVARLNKVFWQNYENKQNLQTSIRALTTAQHEEGRVLETKYKILFGIGHEFRTPINGIVSMLSLLKKSDLGIEQKEQLDVADRSAQQLLSLVELLLEQSEIGSSTLAVGQSVFNLHREIDICMEQLGPLAAGREIELWVVYTRDMPHRVKGDPNRIKQIVTNLVTNVMRVTQCRRVIVLVDLQRESSGEGRLKAEVFDEEFGLAKFESNGLVSEFSADGMQNAIRTEQLGSVLSRELAKSMGGEIGVSRGNDRASLWFTASLGISSQQNRTFTPYAKLNEKRVVVIGFSEWAARSLLFYLEAWSMEITVAGGFDADTSLASSDLLILAHDVSPPASLSIPIIRVVPLQQVRRDTAPGRNGGTGLLSTPVIEEQLHRLVIEMLGLKSLGPEKAQGGEEKWQQDLSRERNILLVEDDRINQLSTEKMLHQLGYQVDIASNGDEALLKLGRMDFDLVLMDCQLPGMSGFETALEIKRQQQDRIVKSPILALTANVRQGEEARCIAAGMAGYLAKPVQVDDLDVKLRQLLI
tara:strand:- start:11270 stop:13447 length:2178 start_codon:yes stop_codon:yes gene_type:complete